MIIFIYGEDNFRALRKLKEIEKKYKSLHKKSFSFEKISSQEVSFEDFWSKFKQRSIFAEKKLFFLKDVFLNKNFKENFLNKIKELENSSNITVVSEQKKPLSKEKLFSELKKRAKTQEFSFLKEQKLREWVKKEFEKSKVIVDSKALDKLIEFVGSDSWRMFSEIEKLKNYKKGTIREEDINLLIKPKIDNNVFKTVEALAKRDKRKALWFVENHLAEGDSPFYVLAMVSFQFRNLLMAGYFREERKSLGEFNKLKFCHPFAAQKAWRASSNFSFSEIKKIYQKVFETDIEIKTGAVSPEKGLRLLATEI